MINETKLMLGRASAGFLGFALPSVLLGRGIMFGLLAAGLLCGLMATRGNSLRATVKIMLESWVMLAAVGLLLVLLLCSFLGIAPQDSLQKWLDLLILIVCTGGVFLVLREMPGAQVELLLKCLAIGTLALAGLSVLDAVVSDDRLNAALHGADKATLPNRLNFVSSALCVLLPYVWTRLMIKAREGEALARRFALPLTLFSVLAVVVCGGVAGCLGLLAAGVVYVVLAGRWHGLVVHKQHWGLLLLTLVVAVATYGFSLGFEVVPERLGGLFQNRMQVWQQAVAHLLDQPLTGLGLQAFKYLPQATDTHPHNWLLQMLLETGILGTAAFVLLLGLVVQRFWRFAPANPYGVAALASLAAFLVAGLGNTSIFNIWWLSFLMFSLLLGWRAGWGGVDMATRRRMRVVQRRDLVPYGKR